MPSAITMKIVTINIARDVSVWTRDRPTSAWGVMNTRSVRPSPSKSPIAGLPTGEPGSCSWLHTVPVAADNRFAVSPPMTSTNWPSPEELESVWACAPAALARARTEATVIEGQASSRQVDVVSVCHFRCPAELKQLTMPVETAKMLLKGITAECARDLDSVGNTTGGATSTVSSSLRVMVPSPLLLA